MGWGFLPDTPMWALFRLEWRRRWGFAGARRPLRILVVVVVLELLLAYVCARSHAVDRSTVGLLKGLLFRGVGPPHPFDLIPAGPWGADGWAGLALTTIVGAAALFAMPAYAALALAGERESRRMEELAVTRLTPAGILAAKSVAALGPFVAASVAAWLLTGVLGTGDWRHVRSTPIPVALTGLVALSVSSLCRRTYTALALCYATTLAVLFLAPWLWLAQLWGSPVFVYRALWLVAPLVALVALALRALRYPLARLP